mgnify:CR=1 FL=1
MHLWGDETVDWGGIDAAARFIGEGLRFWRIDVRQWKEKYGTVRVYCSFGFPWWQSLTHPGHVWCRWPRWLDFITYAHSWYNPFYFTLRLLNLVVIPFHVWLYKFYYRKACRKWPHLREEILRGADYYELLGASVTNQQIWWPELGDEEPK